MRYWCVFFVLLWLPLQWAWAESASCGLQAHAAASYPHVSVAAPFAMEPGSDLRETGDAVPPAPRLSIPAESAIHADLPRWEFELDEEFDIVEQISEPDWSDVAMDHLSCRAPTTENSYGGPPLDPHEFDRTPCVTVIAPLLGDSLSVTVPHPPAPAPVFRAYRPPSLTA